MNKKVILSFILGFGVGALGGVLGTKKFLENKYQNQYENDRNDLEEYYKGVDKYARVEHDDEDDESKIGGRMSKEERAEIKEKLDRNWKGTTNYAKMYDEKNGASEESSNVETEDQNDEQKELEDVPEEYESLDEDAFDDHQKNKNKPPKIISAEAYANLPAHIEQGTLYFYTYDEVLCDENEDPVEEPERLIGDALNKYGFAESDEQIIFVMNYALDTCYEVQKIDNSWEDSH